MQQHEDTMSDRAYINPTWRIDEDCTLRVYLKGDELFALEMTPSQAIKMAADLIIAARRPRPSTAA
jgi:hypothetical protein